MYTIDDHFDVLVTPFSSKVLFYSLFAAVYSLQFGLGSSLRREYQTRYPRISSRLALPLSALKTGVRPST